VHPLNISFSSYKPACPGPS